ncbi:MAG: ATP-dependent helicase [Bacteroides sp.]|nr:ATP-dependent helicase [Bacteroides sp.]
MSIRLNEAQQKAITHGTGPCLVLAGPGSGKTAVITHRTKYLLEEAGIHPEQILVITFTKAAAMEMKERFQTLMQRAYAPCTFGTFHSVFFMILRNAYGYSGEQVLAEEQKRTILKAIVQAMELEYEDEEELLQGLISEITAVKSEYMDLQHYYSTTCGEEEFRSIFRSYEDTLHREHKLDFDDMLVYTYELLKERTDIRQMWQRRFQYILIDEFQDINRIQYEIIRLLAEPKGNLFIVGDDDQSIYRFRGARPEIMLGFQKDYPEAEIILLNINYRSSREIVEGSLRMIENNTKRYQKKIEGSHPYEHPICIHELKGCQEENEDIRKRIQSYHAQGIPYEEMAVIFRTNTEPRRLVNQLMEYNIPFRMRDRLPNCYEHWIARHMMAYIRITMGSRERGDFLQIWNRPKRYLRREWLAEPQIDTERILEQVADKKWAVEHIQKLNSDIERLRKMDPFSAINYIRKGIGYDTYLKEYAEQRRLKPEEFLDILDELQAMAQPYGDYAAWFRHIEEYGEQLEEQRNRQAQLHSSGEAVTLTTMHSSKGLEFQVVFILEANEGITPYKKAGKPEEIEEERRMFYVAVTRAKEYLHIYTIRERNNKKLLPSRFVNEIRLDRANLKVGARVLHRSYGAGTITYMDAKKISIYFDDSKEQKTLSLSFVLEQGLLSG